VTARATNITTMILGAVALLQPLFAADSPRPPAGLRSAVELISDKPARKSQCQYGRAATWPVRSS
jgi:hypothetical protein